MTTPLLEPLLAATAAPPALSAAREAAQRPFRDLLANPPRAASESPRDAEEISPEETADVAVNAPSATLTSERNEHESLNDDDVRNEASEMATPIAGAPVGAGGETDASDASSEAAEVALDKTAADVEPDLPPAPPPETKPKSPRTPPAAGDAVALGRLGDSPVLSKEKASSAEATSGEVLLPADADTAALDGAAIEPALPLAAETEVPSIQLDELQVAAGEKIVSETSEANKQPHKTLRRTTAAASENGRGDAESAGVHETTETASPAGGDQIAPNERSKSKSRDAETREGKSAADGAAQRSGAANEPVAATLAADGQSSATSSTPSAAEASPDAKLTVASDSVAPRSEAAQSNPALPPAASPERLAALVAQRRVKTADGSHGQPLTESQQARLVQRVAKAFDTARMRGEAEIRLRLSPPELGSLKLEVRLESGVLTARLEVETAAAQQALADNLGTLRQRLAEQNIRVEQFDIDLLDRRDDNSPDSQQSPFTHDERHASQRGPRAHGQSPSTNATDAAPQAHKLSNINNSSLDVLI